MVLVPNQSARLLEKRILRGIMAKAKFVFQNGRSFVD